MHSTICEDDRHQQHAVWSQAAIVGDELRCIVTSLSSTQTAAGDAAEVSPWWSDPLTSSGTRLLVDP